MSQRIATRPDVHQEITNRIIAAIEAGAGDCEMPWHRETGHTMPTNVFTGNPYNGVNVVALWVAAEERGYSTGLWATYKQWGLLDAQVRKGEKSSVVVFYKTTNRETTNQQTGEAEKKSFSFARSTFVFNAEQVDGWHPPKPEICIPVEVHAGAESFVFGAGADVRHGGDRAYYQPTHDYIQMPSRERFTKTESGSATEGYYAILLHELTHWTGHGSRLDRNLTKRFGKEERAMEELVAELGAAFLCSRLSITNSPRPDHAAYIDGWLSVLKKDKKAIFTAASKASEAERFLTGLQLSC